MDLGRDNFFFYCISVLPDNEPQIPILQDNEGSGIRENQHLIPQLVACYVSENNRHKSTH